MSQKRITHKQISILRQGFTLIELLVVIAIIGTLVSIFVFSSASARETAMIAKATSESREITNAIRLYVTTNQDLTDEDDDGDPLNDLGLSDGDNDISTTTTRILTDPSANDSKKRYFNNSKDGIRNKRLVDPWGQPYKVHVKEIRRTANTDKDNLAEKYEVILPLRGRYVKLENLPSSSETNDQDFKKAFGGN